MKKIFAITILILLCGCTQQQQKPQEWSIQNNLGTKYGIYIMDIDGTNIQQIYGSNRDLAGVLVSPDKTKIVFYEQQGFMLEATETSELFLINTDGSNLEKLTDNDWIDVQPRWSPDSSKILFVSTGGKNIGTDLYVMDVTEKTITQLTSTIGISEADPDWKCGKIVFTRDYSIWIMDDDGTNMKKLTEPPEKGTGVGVQFPLGDYDPDLSTDCTKVVFSRLVGPGKKVGETQVGDYDLHVYDLSSETETEISNDDGADSIPEWSSNNKIVFINVGDVAEDMYDIFMINPDGTGRTKITGNDPINFVETGCSWYSDKVLFTAEFFE
jgi:Tol biopolymer transport system component